MPPATLMLVAVGPARTVPMAATIPVVAGDSAALRSVDVCAVQLFERFCESGPRVDFCVIVTPIGADRVPLHSYADELTGGDPDELLDFALAGGAFAAVDELDELLDLRDA
ncbi:hypothetical protein KTE96_26155 [Burkholderia multivorans]|uniref:hypothetical protein n=1 Tax=Burkholderia multivorans TaxID=87883 RepID=UPI001C22592E|nr:hypothetical protein [Burkholderia multivorans]MBU9615223.1 hypothetical protein [Burkholderia multivorans]